MLASMFQVWTASRDVQVFFPSQSADQAAPPQWFFDQSPSQVKAAFLAKRKKDELDQVCHRQPQMNTCHRAAISGRQAHNYPQFLLYDA